MIRPTPPPQANLFETITTALAAVGSEVERETREIVQPLRLAQAMWTHGHSIQIENPDAVVRTWRAGFFTEIEGQPSTSNWIHCGIPTKVIVADQRLKAGSAMIAVHMSDGAAVRHVHVYDGHELIAEHYEVNLAGPIGFVRFEIPGKPPVELGISISIGVTLSPPRRLA